MLTESQKSDEELETEQQLLKKLQETINLKDQLLHEKDLNEETM